MRNIQIHKHKGSKRGSIAVICLALVCITVMVAAALATDGVARLAATRRNISHDQALCIAEAGADYGAAKAKADSNYVGSNTPVNFGGGTFTVTVGSANGIRTVTSVGRITGGTNATVKVGVAGSNGAAMAFPNGAMVANGNISLSGQGNSYTTPSTQHQASAWANGDITLSGQAHLDGGAYAHGTVSLSGQSSTYSGTQNNAPLVKFPTKAEHDAWQAQLSASAQAGTKPSGNITKNTTWASPVYINGDLTVSSKATLTITGGGVVFVNGNINLSGQTKIINSGQLVASGSISQSGQALYTISGNVNQAALISFASNSNAISITGQGTANPFGVVYAANGGIKVSGQGDVSGALVAAGENGLGQVNINGQGGIYYPADLLKNSQAMPPSQSFEVKSWLEM